MKTKIDKNNSFKILISNIVFLIFFGLFGEISFRTIKYVYKCAKNECDKKIFTLKPYEDSVNLGIQKPHKLLGYAPQDNLSLVINQKGWNFINVNTNLHGIRESNITKKDSNLILNVGDSFAFGDQVSDSETYQYCLNNFADRKFINAGVSGYGTGQAILRAKELYPKLKPSGLLVQTLVGRDFARDRLSIKSGFVKPYFSINENGKINIISPTSLNTPNTKFAKKSIINPLDKLIINITLLSKMPREFPVIGNITNSLRLLYKHSLARINSTIYRDGENPANIQDIIDWSISESQKLDPNVVWLLTYDVSYTEVVMEERKILLEKLRNANIKYIDTYDYFFGILNKGYSNRDLWYGHHTPLGNDVICTAIRESKIYKISKIKN
tara:strand:+ start:1015 stop:2166 length:1152 start_codon:yes stop_codon:yes gene_type:complete